MKWHECGLLITTAFIIGFYPPFIIWKLWSGNWSVCFPYIVILLVCTKDGLLQLRNIRRWLKERSQPLNGLQPGDRVRIGETIATIVDRPSRGGITGKFYRGASTVEWRVKLDGKWCLRTHQVEEMKLLSPLEQLASSAE